MCLIHIVAIIQAFEDEHSIRAEWKTLEELRILDAQQQLRSKEPLEWAEYLESGGGCASLEVSQQSEACGRCFVFNIPVCVCMVL